MAQIPVGIQMYTLRNETEQDFVGTLRKVADIGYKAVEFAGYGDLPAKELRKLLDDLGLVASSSHVNLPFGQPDALQSELDRHIDINLELGSRYIINPWAPIEEYTTQEQFDSFYQMLLTAAKECKRQGIGFGYHNHAFEFAKRDGKLILDTIYETLPADLLKAELDLYWVKKGGLNPLDYLLSYKGRCPIIHVKDMEPGDEGFFAEVGQGVIDYPPILEAAKGAGVEFFIVEQDQCRRAPLDCIKTSFEYLKSIGVA